MKKYLANLELGFLRYQQYPLEFIFIVFKRVLQIIFIVVLWDIISKDSSSSSVRELVIYFIIFNATSDLIMAQTFSLGSNLADSIHKGTLNNMLIKPVNPPLYMYSKTLGRLLPLICVSVLAVILLIFLGDLRVVNIPFFFLYLLLGIVIGASLNTILASFAFYFTKIFGLREIFKYMTRIFSGSFIPIYFMPETITKILDSSFISYIGYKPVMIMLGRATATYSDLLLGLIWSVVLILIANVFWMRSKERYEAYGI